MIASRPRLPLSLLFVPIVAASIFGVPQTSEVFKTAEVLAQPQPAANPFPLRRIIIPLERIPGELQRSGVLVQMTRDEFEAKLRKATASYEEMQRPPRLVKAFYTAELVGHSLTNGSGQWTVHHGGAAGVMPVPAFNLALSKIKLGSADAVFGNLDGKNLGLWVGRTSEVSKTSEVFPVYFDWSARGETQVHGLAFELRVPPCPMTIFEIKLPADQSVILAKNAGMLSGPFATERSGQQLWRIQATGRSQINFVVRKSSAATGAQQVFATVNSRQELAAGAVQADFEVSIEAVQSAVTELLFDFDPALQPFEVSMRQAELKNWDVLPAAGDAKGKGPALAVRLREPKVGSFQARIRCLAARPAKQEWTSPAMRLRQAIPRGETLVLVVPAAHPVDRWDPGQFRLVGASADKDGGQTLNLVDLDPEAAAPRRPRLTLITSLSDLHVRQQSRWTITPAGMTLNADLACQVQRGQQFQLGVRLPGGAWRVDDVIAEPKEALRSWTAAGPLLTIDLQRALDPRNPGKFTVRLRAPLEQLGNGARVLKIPEVEPLAATQRQATYAIHVDPALQATLASASVPATLPDADQLRAETPPWFVFVYRNQPLQGALRLHGPRTMVDARIQERVALHPERGDIETRLEIEPVIGQPAHVDLLMSAAVRGDWSVVSVDSAALPRLERDPAAEAVGALLIFGAQSGFERALTLAHLPRGQRWRLLFDRPLTQKTTFILRGAIASAPSHGVVPAVPLPGALWPGVVPGPDLVGDIAGRRWDIPLTTVLHAERSEHEVVLQPSGLDVARAAWLGIKPHAGGPGAAARVFRADEASAIAALVVWTTPRAGAGESATLLDDATLTSYLDGSGQSLHHFRFRAVRWTKPELPVALPLPARQILAIRLDGKWLDRVAQNRDGDVLQVRLPMPLDGNAHWFDLLYSADTVPVLGPLGFEASAAMPRLPAAPLRQRRLWRLAPGLAPLYQENASSLHQGAGSPAIRLRDVWHSADALVDAVAADNGDDWREFQRRVLLDAESKIPRKAPRERTLGDALQQLLFASLKEQAALVIDQAALRDAGIGPDTPLPVGSAAAQPFWQALGLVYVAAPAAPMLTTRQRWQEWRQPQALPERLHDSVADAVAHGQDALGQLCRADVWLRRESAARHEQLAAAPLADWFAQGWTEWTPPGDSHEAHWIVVSLATIRGLGLVSAGIVLLLVALVRGRLSSANRLRLSILLLVVAVFGLFSMPMTLAELAIWPAGLLVALLLVDYPRFLRSARGKAGQSNPSSQRHKVIVSGCALLAAAAGAWQAAAQTEPAGLTTVYFADAGSGRVLAFARPELLKKFDEWEQRAAQPVQGAVLIGARYQGKWAKDASDLQAQFDLYSFSDKAVLHVPLGGVDLKEGAFLDGAPVFPTAAAGKVGVQVPVQGKGWHRLTLAMSVRHQLAGEHQEARAAIPSLPMSHVEWQAPASLTNLQTPRPAGDSRLTLDAGAKTQELRAHIGRETSLQVRWQAPSAASPVAEHEVREHYYWDLDPLAPSLTALLTYTPARANLTQLQVALPDKTEVRGVEAGSGGAALPLAKWQVRSDGGPRRLVIDLAAPASGPFAVQVRMAPRGGLLGEAVSLRLPMPLQVKALEGVLAYRLEGWEITDKAKNLGVTGLTPATFAEVWTRSGARSAAAPTRAYNFRRAAANASLDLTLQPDKTNVRLEFDWLVHASGADLQLQAALASPRALLTADLALPAGLKVHEVRGPNLHHWTVQDQSLRVWLEKPSDQVSISVAGSIDQPLKNQRFALPPRESSPMQSVTATVAVRAGAGWTVAPERLLHLKPLAPGPETRFQATQAGYEGVFVLRPAAVAPIFHALTALEPRGDHVALTTTVLGWLAPGSVPELTVRLRPWSGAVPHLELSMPALRRHHRQMGDDHVWTVQFAPGGARMVLMKLRGKIETGADVTVPHLEIEGGKLLDEQIAWPAGALDVRESRGLKDAKNLSPASRHGLAAFAFRGPASAWIAEDPQWRCVLAAPAAPNTRPGKVLLAEQQAQPDGGGRWLHQADWLLMARELRELRLELPAAAVPIAAFVDGHAVLPRAVAAGGLEIPLANPSGMFHVRLLWRYPDDHEDPRRPRLAAPALADVEPAEVHGTVTVQSGMAVHEPPLEIVEHDHKHLDAVAKASLEAADYWVKQGPQDGVPAPHLAWQRQFQQAWRHLDYQALLHKDAAAQEAAANLRKAHPLLLKQDNAASKASDKNGIAWRVARAERGLPMFWSGAAPTLVLQPAAPAALAPWWSRETVALIVIGVFCVSWLPYGLTWFVRLWPEQLAALAALGYALWGVSAVGAVLLAVAALGRLFGLMAWSHRQWTASSAAANVEP